MGDMTTITARVCNTAKMWERQVEGSGDMKYYVRYSTLRSTNGPVMGYTCSCPAFVYRGGECKHIKAVASERCGYGEEAFSGSPAADDSFLCNICMEPESLHKNKRHAFVKPNCPECGSATFIVEVAV